MNYKSDDIAALAAALAKAQASIVIAEKSAQNTYYRSQYAGLPEVWAACRKALTDNQLSVVQRLDTSENGMVMESLLLHSSGQWISSTYPVRPMKDDPQSLGSALTYARRYALMALVGVVADDAADDDGNAASGNNDEPGIGRMMQAESSTEANVSRKSYFKNQGLSAAKEGRSALAAWWGGLQEADRRGLVKYKADALDSIASEADGIFPEPPMPSGTEGGIETEPDIAQQEKSESMIDGRTAAANARALEFFVGATAFLDRVTDSEALKSWHDQNLAKIVRLRARNAAAHKELLEKIESVRAGLEPAYAHGDE